MKAWLKPHSCPASFSTTSLSSFRFIHEGSMSLSSPLTSYFSITSCRAWTSTSPALVFLHKHSTWYILKVCLLFSSNRLDLLYNASIQLPPAPKNLGLRTPVKGPPSMWHFSSQVKVKASNNSWRDCFHKLLCLQKSVAYCYHCWWTRSANLQHINLPRGLQDHASHQLVVILTKNKLRIENHTSTANVHLPVIVVDGRGFHLLQHFGFYFESGCYFTPSLQIFYPICLPHNKPYFNH